MATVDLQHLGTIHNEDCIAGLKELPDGLVDLAFADPPFNIGYEYDVYEDQLESEKYIAWSKDWMRQVHRVLKDNGTFWLAIGDEYAAELKVAAQSIGFHCRSWVVWYYTFGVHCSKKFTRSHAHLFHFVKDEKNFVFNHDDKELRVPSARQLVYNDARANPKGRMPDDTWILRPQDLVDGFNPDEDVWYFPRVAGTFKERAGFHGCQMPEQLLGRIIRACSSENDVVLDPFSGSATTLAVAKKLRRQFVGFELSPEYTELGIKRLSRVAPGDSLDGSEEPKVSAPRTDSKKPNKRQLENQKQLFEIDNLVASELAAEAAGIVEAFAQCNRGFSVDRMVADPILNEDFQLACERRNIPGTAAERNRFLFRLRKSGKLKSVGIETSVRTEIDWEFVAPFVFASEIAWRQVSNKYCSLGLDDIFCDPRIASQFDTIASKFAPGFEVLDYRWAALKLRKEGHLARKRAEAKTPKQLGIAEFSIRKLSEEGAVCVDAFDAAAVPNGPGVYLIRQKEGAVLYAGETENLPERLQTQFGSDELQRQWNAQYADLKLYTLAVESTIDFRLARQSILLKWYKPKWNLNHILAV